MDYGERVKEYRANLRDASDNVIVELATTRPGGEMDFPSAPIDPALSEAAMEVANERGLSVSALCRFGLGLTVIACALAAAIAAWSGLL